MRRAVWGAALVLLVPLVQVVALNRLPLGGPDLALLVTIGWALGTRPARAAGYGFAIGLVSDLVPPVEHTIGIGAGVLCLTGYLCAVAAESRWRPAIVALAVPTALVVEAALELALGDAALAGVRAGFPGAALWTLPIGVLATMRHRRSRRGHRV